MYVTYYHCYVYDYAYYVCVLQQVIHTPVKYIIVHAILYDVHMYINTPWLFMLYTCNVSLQLWKGVFFNVIQVVRHVHC